MSTCGGQLRCLLSGGMEKYLICVINQLDVIVGTSADIVSVDDDFLTKQKIIIPRAHISLTKRHDGKVMG